MSEQAIEVGDTVRVKDPSGFVSCMAKKIANREAVVDWIGPDRHGQFEGLMWVTFGKRNGRGKEFRERMRVKEFEIVRKGDVAASNKEQSK